MRKLTCQGNVRYWALGISVALHAAALAVFTGVRLSDNMTGNVSNRPSVSMQMIETVIEQPAPVPKPKVEPISKVEPEPEPEPKPELKPEPEPLVTEEKLSPQPVPEPVEIVEPVPSAPKPVVHEVEFFGQKSIVQRICYVVDCSGSMYGQMYRVKEQLKQSIMKLNPQQAFCVLFFMDGRQILMTGSGRLESATVGAKSQAFGLINKIKPAGSTDASHALECAMRLRDKNKHSPEVIYFLTDGFDLDDSGSQLFVEKIGRLRNSLAPAAVLHTIGFWPQDRDRMMLERLAQNASGNYIEVQ
ncbi:MAG: VWA domain-containing protein [Phycisphaerae bacterium]|nr:VWA domain-containing protein [Phycisphaerae bacterium]